jgi:hypothetical protein
MLCEPWLLFWRGVMRRVQPDCCVVFSVSFCSPQHATLRNFAKYTALHPPLTNTNRTLPFKHAHTVAELYSSWFGANDVMVPFIEQATLSVDDPEEKLKWVMINICKIEDDQRELIAKEAKKKAEAELVRKRREEGGGDMRRDTEDVDDATDFLDMGEQLVTIPKLEMYSGLVSAKPVYLLIKDGQVLARLTESNPPLLKTLVQKGVTDATMTAAESNLDADILDLTFAREEEDEEDPMDVDDEDEEERAKAQAAFDAERGPATQVEITLRCRSLVTSGDDFDRCDPMVQVSALCLCALLFLSFFLLNVRFSLSLSLFFT